MRFFTSDTYFGHVNIIKYCDRPFKDTNHMNQVIVENWNTVVSTDDVVYHLGDVALGQWEDWDKWLSQLNGHKHLIIGNHDRVFEGAYNQSRIEKFMPVYKQWFEHVHLDGGVFIGPEEKYALLSHFPYTEDHFENARYLDYRLPDNGELLIHGHTHLNTKFSLSSKGTKQIHVGQDAWGFTPVSETQIIELLEAERMPAVEAFNGVV